MKTYRAALTIVATGLALTLVTLSLLNNSRIAQAADHRDAPAISEDGRADILDVFAFVNPNSGNVVLALTVNPFSIPGATMVAFSPDALYEFKIDNNGDYQEDVVIQATFTPTVPGPQKVTVSSREVPGGKAKIKSKGKDKGKAKSVHFSLTGLANGSVTNGTNGVRLFAGLRDDPFFFDLIWTFRLLGIQPGGPISRTPGIDFFAGLNASILAVEVPPSVLRGPSGNSIHLWATTSRSRVTLRSDRITRADKGSGGFVQIERMGLPVINTVLIPSALKDAFNRGTPSQDRAFFRDASIASLVKINNDSAYSAQITDLLLPDVVTLDVTKTDGFLNGRRPQDDVIDTVLNVASKGAVLTDNVSANDVPFLNDFPFFAPPHPPAGN